MPLETRESATGLRKVRSTINYSRPIAGRGRYDLVDPSRMNLAVEPHEIWLSDARPSAGDFTLDRNGFQLVSHRSRFSHLQDKAELRRLYIPEVSPVICEFTGAHTALPLLNGLTLRKGVQGGKGGKFGAAAHFAHLDYTAASAERYIPIAQQWAGVDRLPPFSRFAICQCWRATSLPPHSESFGFTDARTVSLNDMIPADTIMVDEKDHPHNFESYWVRYNPGHRWYFFSNMTADDLILFKGYDSDQARPSHVVHSAFYDCSVPENPVQRTNVEIRFILFFT